MDGALPGAVAVVFAPLGSALLAFLLPRRASQIGMFASLAALTGAAGLAALTFSHGAQRLSMGGWGAPLGIDLYLDGLSATLLLMTALVGGAITLYATGYFHGEGEQREYFWPLWLILWGALNALFLSADLFNLYITLELLGLSSVALTALSGEATALRGAMRYLLVTMLGSLTYLLGVALLYHAWGTLDLAILSARVAHTPLTAAALGAITVGLLFKTALFPFHFWLPPAHASAPSPVSAMLSALVVKGSFYLLVRVWLQLGGGFGGAVAALLGGLGAVAIVWGSVQALRQERLKLLVAYSTVAQIGYLFLVFPLAAGGSAVWEAGVYLALSHALGKAAMFLAAGNLLRFGRHDRIADLDRAVHRLPLTVAAFTLGGVSIMGLPPSGGFIGKWLLLEAAFRQERWGLALVMVIGGVLAAAYVFKVVGYAFTPTEVPQTPCDVPRSMEWSALTLAAGAILLGFAAPLLMPLLAVGAPFPGSSP